MKFYCEKCNSELTKEMHKKFESFEIGRIQCKECGKIQSRYLSESDMLIYLGLSEILYLILSLFSCLVFYYIGIKWWSILILLMSFVCGFYIQKSISYFIYTKAPSKSDYATKDFKEDLMQIKRSMNWQFILFFALAITAITGTSFQLFFLIVALFAVMLTFVKFFLCIKKERSKL